MNDTQCMTTCGGEMITQTRTCSVGLCNATETNNMLAANETRPISCGPAVCPGKVLAFVLYKAFSVKYILENS